MSTQGGGPCDGVLSVASTPFCVESSMSESCAMAAGDREGTQVRELEDGCKFVGGKGFILPAPFSHHVPQLCRLIITRVSSKSR